MQNKTLVQLLAAFLAANYTSASTVEDIKEDISDSGLFLDVDTDEVCSLIEDAFDLAIDNYEF